MASRLSPELSREFWEGVIKDVLNGRDTTHTSNNEKLEVLVESLFKKHFSSILYPCDEQWLFGTQSRPSRLAAVDILPSDADIWIFGYGSLMWKASFPFIDKRQGYVEGYQRRFFQNSIEHRGTPEKPGRVVTLVGSEAPHNRVYGRAYRIAKDQKGQVLAHLDKCEKNGYQRCVLEFTEFRTGHKFNIIMYIPTNSNGSFAGGSDKNLLPIAIQISQSAGTSGSNRDYLYNLADSMRELFPGVEDKHLFNLEAIVRAREYRDTVLAEKIKKEIGTIMCKEPAREIPSDYRKLVINSRRGEQFLDKWFGEIENGRGVGEILW